MTISVLLADDQALLRTGFRMVLEAQSDITVAGEAADGGEAADLVTSDVDPIDKPETRVDQANPVNQRFGRRFEIVSFRRMNPSELR